MIDTYRQFVQRLEHQHQLAKVQVQQETKAKEQAQAELDTTAEAQGIIQSIAQTIQQQAHRQIAEVVTRCLNAVFDDPYEFEIKFERKRGKTEAKLVFVRDGLELDDPLNEAGGGPIDVAALALRLACVLLAKPPRRRMLVLDEPFKNIRGRGNRHRVRLMLTRLAEELGVQFVACVDADSYPEFALGKVVEL